MQIELAILISIVSVVFSIFFGLKNNKRSDTKDIEERVRNDTKINVKLDNISQTTQDIKNEIASMRDDIKSHNDRIIKVEESVKQAHKRLDIMENRLDGKEEQHER
jgi:septal ring factor EnvC (AmiA/AmiB activator)